MKHNTDKCLHTAVGNRMSEQTEGNRRKPSELPGGGAKTHRFRRVLPFHKYGNTVWAVKKKKVEEKDERTV